MRCAPWGLALQPWGLPPRPRAFLTLSSSFLLVGSHLSASSTSCCPLIPRPRLTLLEASMDSGHWGEGWSGRSLPLGLGPNSIPSRVYTPSPKPNLVKGPLSSCRPGLTSHLAGCGPGRGGPFPDETLSPCIYLAGPPTFCTLPAPGVFNSLWPFPSSSGPLRWPQGLLCFCWWHHSSQGASQKWRHGSSDFLHRPLSSPVSASPLGPSFPLP